MRLKYIIAADQAEFTAGSTLNMMGGEFSTITVGKLPATHPLICVVARITFGLDEQLNQHVMSCSIVHDLSGEIVAQAGPSPLNIPKELTPPPEAKEAFMALNMKFAFVRLRHQGKHVIKLEVNGEELGRTSFRVVQAEDPGISPDQESA